MADRTTEQRAGTGPGRDVGAGDVGAGDVGAGDAGRSTRDAIRTAVSSRAPMDERERWAQQCILDVLDKGTDRGELIHVTASAVVVSSHGVLLHVHKRLRRWTLPGGHVDPGEHPGETAARETMEETGVPAAHPGDGPVVVHLDVYRSARAHTHLDLRYLLHAPPLRPDPPPNESQHVAWFGWDEALAVVDPGVAAALRSAGLIVQPG